MAANPTDRRHSFPNETRRLKGRILQPSLDVWLLLKGSGVRRRRVNIREDCHRFLSLPPNTNMTFFSFWSGEEAPEQQQLQSSHTVTSPELTCGAETSRNPKLVSSSKLYSANIYHGGWNRVMRGTSPCINRMLCLNFDPSVSGDAMSMRFKI